MNRREMLTAMGASVAAVGGNIEYVPDPETVPLLIKIKCPRRINKETQERIRCEWKRLDLGPLSDVPVVILEDGMDIEIVARESEK